MRWHSYQSLVARARRKRVGSTGILPVGRSGVSPEHVVANFRQAGSPPAPQAGCLCYLRRIIRFRLRARLTLRVEDSAEEEL
jgi:hypothetical protein